MVKTNINIVLVMLLSGAALFTSCRDDFDWDDAHAPELYKDFTKVFVKEFGKPESGHQWGFDTPWNIQKPVTGETRAYSGPSGTPITIKMEEGFKGYSQREIIATFGFIQNISEQEHNEVYEWFCKHKVTWEQTTTLDNSVTFDGRNSTRNTNTPKQAIKTAELSEGNSLLLNTPSYWLENPYIGLTFDVKYAWIQSVASFSDPGVWDTKAAEEAILKQTYGEGFTYESDENDFDNHKNIKVGMNQLKAAKADGNFTEINDFNRGDGRGHVQLPNDPDPKGTYGTFTIDGKEYTKNANIIYANGASMSNLSAQSDCDGNLMHDKWIIVYLKGDGYEGWYLGMDAEGGGSARNMKVPANGVCNDWIIKLSAAGGARNNARILCEDLGSKEGVNSSDIDYNDIVFDVDYETLENYNNTTSGAVKITAKAAGGTLPLMVYYGDTPLFESHEFLRNGDVYTDQNRKKDDAFYKTMINTNAASYDLDGVDNVSSKSYTLFFNGAEYAFSTGESYNSNNKTHRSISGTPPTWEDIKSNIKIKVYRFDRSEYINGGSNNINEAEWVHVTNETGSAPVKICVPQNVKWLKERQKINLGYAGFNNWVINSNELFWNVSGTINSDYLYNETN